MDYMDITTAEIMQRLGVVLAGPVPVGPDVATLALAVGDAVRRADMLSAEIALVMLEKHTGHSTSDDVAQTVVQARWLRRGRAITANPVLRPAP